MNLKLTIQERVDSTWMFNLKLTVHVGTHIKWLELESNAYSYIIYWVQLQIILYNDISTLSHNNISNVNNCVKWK